MKNMLKRCVIDPICQLISTARTFSHNEVAIINTILKKLLAINQLLTPHLKDWLREPVKLYIVQLRNAGSDSVDEVEQLANKCQLVHLTFDYFNLDQI
jgi:hypothetical protein